MKCSHISRILKAVVSAYPAIFCGQKSERTDQSGKKKDIIFSLRSLKNNCKIRIGDNFEIYIR